MNPIELHFVSMGFMSGKWEGFLWHEVNKEIALVKFEINFNTKYEAKVKM